MHIAAYLIAILNILVPNILKLINNLESHSRQGTFQASLYAKIATFRWINTAIVMTIIKPFTATIAVGETALIPAVYAVLKAEIITAPVLHMCDVVGQVKRFVLAPPAANQAAMNSYFRGSVQNLGEKYTNMTKVMFLCCFYSVIFPASFFFGAVAIAATYATDKFLLMRSWAPLPKLGDDVALLSRRVFFPLTLVTLLLVSGFYWSAYPFDDACDSDMVVSSNSYPEYIGTHVISTSSGESFHVTLTGDGTEELYQFCDQDFLERISALFSFFQQEKDDWMSPDQEVLTYLFGILCVVVLVILGCVALVFGVIPNMREVVGGDYMTTERDSGDIFCAQQHINAYVPQVAHRKFSYPLLACDGVNKMNQINIGWTDPVHSHDFYDKSNDVIFLSNGKPPSHPVLTTIRYWKPSSSLSSSHVDTSNSKGGYGSVSS